MPHDHREQHDDDLKKEMPRGAGELPVPDQSVPEKFETEPCRGHAEQDFDLLLPRRGHVPLRGQAEDGPGQNRAGVEQSSEHVVRGA